jgi:hypothetical protein
MSVDLSAVVPKGEGGCQCLVNVGSALSHAQGIEKRLLLLSRDAQSSAPVGFHNHFGGFIHIRHSGSSMTDMNDAEQICINGARDPAYSIQSQFGKGIRYQICAQQLRGYPR